MSWRSSMRDLASTARPLGETKAKPSNQRGKRSGRRNLSDEDAAHIKFLLRRSGTVDVAIRTNVSVGVVARIWREETYIEIVAKENNDFKRKCLRCGATGLGTFDSICDNCSWT